MQVDLKLAEKIANELLGSCQDLEEVLEYYNIPTDATCPLELLQMIDQRVLQCDQCGGWSKAHEVTNGICTDCEEENDYS